MRRVFADTSFWVAIGYRRDQWHDRANAARRSIEPVRVVTTQEILGEVLTYFSDFGAAMRTHISRLVRALEDDADVQIIQQTPESFRSGQALYEQRPDKGYSFVDCVSMQTMRRLGLTEVLTSDHHFEQEGFIILLRD